MLILPTQFGFLKPLFLILSHLSRLIIFIYACILSELFKYIKAFHETTFDLLSHHFRNISFLKQRNRMAMGGQESCEKGRNFWLPTGLTAADCPPVSDGGNGLPRVGRAKVGLGYWISGQRCSSTTALKQLQMCLISILWESWIPDFGYILQVSLFEVPGFKNCSFSQLKVTNMRVLIVHRLCTFCTLLSFLSSSIQFCKTRLVWIAELYKSNLMANLKPTIIFMLEEEEKNGDSNK